MDIIIRISTDTAAFDGFLCGTEIGRILNLLARALVGDGAAAVGTVNGSPLRDINGNTVGTVEVTD